VNAAGLHFTLPNGRTVSLAIQVPPRATVVKTYLEETMTLKKNILIFICTMLCVPPLFCALSAEEHRANKEHQLRFIDSWMFILGTEEGVRNQIIKDEEACALQITDAIQKTNALNHANTTQTN